MGRALAVLILIGSISFIFIFNNFGELWDMSAYSQSKDRPADKAFMKPQIYSGSEKKALYFAGKDLVLSTAVFGGNLKFQWYYNGEILEGADSNILFMFRANTNNSGIYSLEASNELGTTKYDFDVLVEPKEKSLQDGENAAPRVVYNTGGGKAVIGRPFSIAVTATGKSNVYRWYKNGQQVTNATSHRLLFTEFKRYDTGTYEVRIVNEFGMETFEIEVYAVRESGFQGDS